MRAMVLYDWVKKWGDNLKLEEREVPRPSIGEVLVKVEACGVGLTVSNFLIGDMAPDKSLLPRIPGHEIAGKIEEAGQGVENVSVGDRVVAYFYLSCDRCRFCLMGRQDMCLNFAGYVGLHIDGGYAEYVKLPARNVFRIPSTLNAIDATVICDAVATPVHVASDRAKISPGDLVMVLGAGGGVGIHMVQVAKLYGGEVIAVDISDEKLSKAREVGASFAVNSLTSGWEEKVKEFSDGKGVDVVIDFVGDEQLTEKSISLLARRGRYVQLTTRRGRITRAENRRLVLEEITILGSRYCTKNEFQRAIELIANGKVKPVISIVKRLEEVESIHAVLAEGKMVGRGATYP